MTHHVTLRASCPDDKPFLYEIYSGIRRDEVASLGWSREQEEAFFRMQFAARQHSYRNQFPDASYSIIELGKRPVGGMLVARDGDGICLVDIALLHPFRGKGIGRKLIAELLDQGAKAGLGVRLSVVKGNRAINLYRRLGFSEVGEDAGGVYVKMEKPSHKRAIVSESNR